MSRHSPALLARLDQEYAELQHGVDQFVGNLAELLANAEAAGVCDAEAFAALVRQFLASDTFDRFRLAALYATACLRLARSTAGAR